MNKLKNCGLMACVIILSAPAVAQEAKKESWYISTKAEYSACLDEADRLEKLDAGLEQRRATRDAELEQHQEQMQAHSALRLSLNPRNVKAVEEFNDRLRVLNARTEALNAEGTDFNLQLSEFQEKVRQYNERCAGIKVGIPDVKAVRKIRGK